MGSFRIKEEKYIFFYGGDLMWANHFKKKAMDVKIAKSSIELYHVKQNASNDGEDDSFSSFWSAIETMSHIKVISKQIGHDEHVVKQVKKLMSYKNSKIGWTVLIQGRRVIIIADGWTMSSVLGAYDCWITRPSESSGNCIDTDFGDDMVDLKRVKALPKWGFVAHQKSGFVTISESSAKLEHFIFRSFDAPVGWIIDAYTPNPKYPTNFDTLSGLWIPIAGEKKWKAHEEEDKYLLHIAERLSCYTARPNPECIRNIKDMLELHKKKNYLALLEMDQRGHVEEYNPAKTIVKERMARFGFKH
ncbi:unnamed protein product [Prunus armeniaca]